MNRTKLKHGLIDWVAIKGGKWQETIKTKSCKETGSVWIRAQFSTAHTSFFNLEGDSYRFSDLLAAIFQTRKWVPSEIKNLFKVMLWPRGGGKTSSRSSPHPGLLTPDTRNPDAETWSHTTCWWLPCIRTPGEMEEHVAIFCSVQKVRGQGGQVVCSRRGAASTQKKGCQLLPP